VDRVSRHIDQKLNFISRNQDAILMGKPRTMPKRRGAIDSDDDTDSDDEADPNRKVFLPSSFHGSPRHRNALALNALHIVNTIGEPTLFITGTTNTKWPEIVSQLLPGQTVFDRPDIVTQVFHARLKKGYRLPSC
jgi:hypothetical protein